MDKIGGAVERIDHPRVFSSFALAALFGQYSVIRIGFKQNLKSDFLGLSRTQGDSEGSLHVMSLQNKILNFLIFEFL